MDMIADATQVAQHEAARGTQASVNAALAAGNGSVDGLAGGFVLGHLGGVGDHVHVISWSG